MPRKYQRKADMVEGLEPPTQKVEALGSLNRLLAHAKDELSRTQHAMSTERATMQSERHRWDLERRRQEDALAMKANGLQLDHAKRMEEVELLRRKVQQSLDMIEAQNVESKACLQSLNEREAMLKKLNQERLDIGRLRIQAETQMFDVQQKLSELQTRENDARAKFEKAEQLMVTCEDRNRMMNDEWNKLNKWQEDLTLKQRDYETLKREVDARLGTLTNQEEPVHADAG